MASGISWLTYDRVIKDDEEEVIVCSTYLYSQATFISAVWFDLKLGLFLSATTETWVKFNRIYFW